MNSRILKNPHYVVSFFLIIIILGIAAIPKLPVQLLPDIGEDRIVVGNFWPGASPMEMERQIVEPVEELLSKVPGVLRYETDTGTGFAWVNMTFQPGTDMQEAYIEVIDKMNQFNTRPKTALEPIIQNKSKDNKGSIAGLVLFPNSAGVPADRARYTEVFEKYVRPRILAIPGISSLSPLASTEQRIDIIFDPEKLTKYTLTIDQMLNILRNSLDQSVGIVEQGTRNFAVRFEGRRDISDLNGLVIAKNEQKVVTLGDVAYIENAFVTDSSPVYWKRQQAFYVSVNAATGSNALASLAQLRKVMTELNTTVLPELGVQMELTKDDSKTINSAVSMVQNNLILGVVLSTLILFLFVRKLPVIAMIFISLPISILATFLAMQVLGRTFNVISLAGIALSTGMILDAAIVVVETAVRYREQGERVVDAIHKTMAEVSGALVNSVVSSIIVFAPILLMQSAEGKLFHDLAITISSALGASLFVALLLLPLLLRYILPSIKALDTTGDFVDRISARLARMVVSSRNRSAMLLLLVVVPIAGLILLAPKLNILPQVEGTRVNVSVNVNQSMNHEALTGELLMPINQLIEAEQEQQQGPLIDKFLSFVSGSSSVQLVLYPKEPEQAEQLKSWAKNTLEAAFPHANVYANFNSLLGFGLSTNRRVTIDFTGTSLDDLQLIGREVYEHLNTNMGYANPWSNTPLYNDDPQIIFTPKDNQLLELGESQYNLSQKLRALTDGVYIGEYSNGTKNLPIYIKGEDWDAINNVMDTPLYFPLENKVTLLRTLVDYELDVGPSSLYRLNGFRTLSINVTPPPSVPLSTFIDDLKVQVTPIIGQHMPQSVSVSYRGSASKLNELISDMLQQFSFAMLILFLLVSGWFKSFRNGLAIMLSLPIALIGGMLALNTVNLFTYQPLDVISMMGFIILIGLVINNAILFVGHFNELDSLRYTIGDKIQLAIKSRARPIYMSTLTSIFGMLPLAIIPGVGSEIYRGLAIVIVGGMTFSAIFSLSVMAALLSLPVFAKYKEREAHFPHAETVS
ncbi:acriflavin resistance protein [Pseudoalteromonas maricaloris]|uniref:efflux RND transporter permease subunit n=1 Tax=Pseudoalteromonas maricaloris TaxID=184924 RepID=UPI0021ADF6C2|nr:efflux RND transporter permease subunit [Pseudoalteromonas flavipulchra]USE70912.1 acriflavin resistance protein [Pseudoalteromonas flavipulchra]